MSPSDHEVEAFRGVESRTGGPPRAPGRSLPTRLRRAAVWALGAGSAMVVLGVVASAPTLLALGAVGATVLPVWLGLLAMDLDRRRKQDGDT